MSTVCMKRIVPNVYLNLYVFMINVKINVLNAHRAYDALMVKVSIDAGTAHGYVLPTENHKKQLLF